jgi:superfamily II DNA or RNA helicase
MFLYIQENKDWLYENKYKYGITQDPYDRINTDQHSHKTIYKALYEITKTDKYKIPYKEYDKIISIVSRNKDYILIFQKHYFEKFENLQNIHKYLVNDNGGTEFIYENGLEILENIILVEFNILGLNVRKIELNEIEKINKSNKNDKDKFDEEFKLNLFKFILPLSLPLSLSLPLPLSPSVSSSSLSSLSSSPLSLPTSVPSLPLSLPLSLPSSPLSSPLVPIVIRGYQQIIINECLRQLIEYNKVYLELATGAGKSTISFSIFNILPNIKVIIIITPRKIITQQNISEKYFNIIKDKFKIHSDFSKNSDKNIIISACIQSYKKIYNFIIKFNLTNILIWFDEAHYGLDDWCLTKNDEIKHFFLKDNDKITKRLFTSASPNKDLVILNKNIFGNLYNPIKVRELIKRKWLCNIIPYIYENDVKTSNTIQINLDIFTKLNKTTGLSFHNRCKNAFELFLKHYKLYIKNKTTIKPYLLLGDEFNHEMLNEISDNLEYDFMNIKEFDNDINNIGYSVMRINMGYDNKKVDILFLSDPKSSYKDNIQTFGRGMRPDQLGIDNTNLKKILHLILHVYINTDDDAKEYNKIKETIRYLLLDIELDIKHFIVNNKNVVNVNNKIINNSEILEENNNINLIFYDIYKKDLIWTNKQIVIQLMRNDIHNYKDYINYQKNKILNLPSNLFEKFPNFKFSDTYRKGECPYYNKKECLKIIKKYEEELTLIFDDDEKLEFLCKKDKKIPNECLWHFYGDSKDDYFT